MTILPRNPFRFGIIGRATSPSQWRDLAHQVEEYGYSSLLVPEHLDTPYSTLSLMSTALEVTTTLRIGSHVLCNDLHNPTLLARDIATMDAFSNGRIELGIGAGNKPQDAKLAGLPFYAPGQRIERLETSVQHIKGLFSKNLQQEGENQTRLPGTDELAFPQVMQRPHPPMYIGGGGKKMLGVAGRQADIIGFTARAGSNGHLDITDLTPESLLEKISWIRAAAGERFSSLEFSMPLLGVALTKQHQEDFNRLARFFGFTGEQLSHSFLSVIGSTDDICQELLLRRELYGISYFTLGGLNIERFAPIVERLSGK